MLFGYLPRYLKILRYSGSAVKRPCNPGVLAHWPAVTWGFAGQSEAFYNLLGLVAGGARKLLLSSFGLDSPLTPLPYPGRPLSIPC